MAKADFCAIFIMLVWHTALNSGEHVIEYEKNIPKNTS